MYISSRHKQQILTNCDHDISIRRIFPRYVDRGLHNTITYKKETLTHLNITSTLLSVSGKLFTKIINDRLNKWADNYYVYVESQAGFRGKMGTVDNVFVLNVLINHFLTEFNVDFTT